MPYTTNYWIQSTGNVQVFVDRDADNNITQTALMVAAKGGAEVAVLQENVLPTSQKIRTMYYALK